MSDGGGERPRLRAERVVWSTVDGEILALDLTTSRYLRLNESAADLWRWMDGTRTRGQLVDDLVAAYDVDRPTAEGDVDAFLTVLTDRGLIEAAGS